MDTNNNKKQFYITTTLPYVNSDPHIGFAMELIRADISARWKKAQGYEVFFNTGTDEHGQKLLVSSQKAGVGVKEYVDKYAEVFRGLGRELGIIEDVKFVRTTDPSHEKAAQDFWRLCDEHGYIYKKQYSVKYCVGCELEKTESELENNVCPIHPNLPIEIIEEENYFFKFSAFENKLRDFYKENQAFVIPDFRFNEIKAFVDRGLEDFSISRLATKMPWGVPVPEDSDHVMYVWFDALVNYISTLGWPYDKEKFEKFWVNGSPVQYCGKDNLRQQSAMWQAMLMAAGLPQTRHIVINGFITSGGHKMSKSFGNVINPYDVVGEFGSEALRYFVARELSTFEDSDFTMERFKEAYNANLANGIGNLTSRIMKMAEAYLDSPVIINRESYKTINQLIDPLFASYLDKFEIGKAADYIWDEIKKLDLIIQTKKPFEVYKTHPDAARQIVKELVQNLARICVLIEPILPATSESIKALIESNKAPVSPLFARKL
jgi:methionyl-tRNA synthetase